MASMFELKATPYFLKQWNSYDEKAKDSIRKKLRLVKLNPFRFPRHEGYRFVFKVKLSIENKYSRLMYAVFMPDENHITILGVFNRNSGYKDFEKIFSGLKS